MSAPDVSRLATDPDWLLAAIDGAGGRYLFARITAETYRRSPFLDRRIDPKPMAFEWVPMDAVHRALGAAPPAGPACYVFHTAFCCSTLLASCLQHLDTVLALKEPTALATTATGRRKMLGPRPGSRRDEGWERAVRPILALLHKRYDTTPHLVVKPSNYCNNLVPEVMAGAGNRCLFLTGSLEEFVQSVLKKPDDSSIERLLDNFLAAFSCDSDYIPRALAGGHRPTDRATKAALVWSHQIDWLAGLAGRWPGRVRTLTAQALLTRPGQSLAAVLDHFAPGAIGTGPREAAEAIVAAGYFREDPKARTAFDADQRARENAAVRARFGAELDRALTWQAALARDVPARALDPALALD